MTMSTPIPEPLHYCDKIPLSLNSNRPARFSCRAIFVNGHKGYKAFFVSFEKSYPMKTTGLILIVLVGLAFTPQPTVEISKCYNAFDLKTDDTARVTEVTVNVQKIMDMDSVFCSYNFCENTRESSYLCEGRIILAPKEGVARLITTNGTFGERTKELLSMAQSGDRVLFEGLRFQKGEEWINLRPAVFLIE